VAEVAVMFVVYSDTGAWQSLATMAACASFTSSWYGDNTWGSPESMTWARTPKERHKKRQRKAVKQWIEVFISSH
jgi:hypothetical protein